MDQARKSGSTSVKIRVFEPVEQRASKFGYYSGGVVYILPERIQARYASIVRIGATVSSPQSSLSNIDENKIVLIDPTIILDEDIQSSGILLFGKFYEILVKTRGKLVNLLHFSLPQPHSSIAAGMLLGVESTIEPDQRKELQTTGLMHVIAASGANLVLVASFLEELLKRMGSRLRAACLIFLIWSYCFLSGSSASILRATLMLTYQILCRLRGREYIGIWALFLSAALMLLFNPFLWFSLSFQLSVAASYAMCEVYPRLSKLSHSRKFAKIPVFLEETFLSSLAVSLVAAPLLIYHFESYSIISFVSNVAMLWIVPYIMVFSVFFLGIVSVLPDLSSTVVIPAWIFLDMWVSLTHLFASIPYAAIKLSSTFGLLMVIPCIVAVFWLYRRGKYVL